MYRENFQIFSIACSFKKQCIQKSSKHSLLLAVGKRNVSRKVSNILYCLQLYKVVYPEKFQIFYVPYSCKKQFIQKSFKCSLLLAVGKRNVSRKVLNILYCLQLEKAVNPEMFQIFFIACSCKKQCIQKSSKYPLSLVVVKSSVSRKVPNILYCLQMSQVVYPKKFEMFLIACSWKKKCIQESFKYSSLLIVVESSVSRKFPNILYCLQL